MQVQKICKLLLLTLALFIPFATPSAATTKKWLNNSRLTKELNRNLASDLGWAFFRNGFLFGYSGLTDGGVRVAFKPIEAVKVGNLTFGQEDYIKYRLSLEVLETIAGREFDRQHFPNTITDYDALRVKNYSYFTSVFMQLSHDEKLAEKVFAGLYRAANTGDYSDGEKQALAKEVRRIGYEAIATLAPKGKLTKKVIAWAEEWQKNHDDKAALVAGDAARAEAALIQHR